MRDSLAQGSPQQLPLRPSGAASGLPGLSGDDVACREVISYETGGGLCDSGQDLGRERAAELSGVICLASTLTSQMYETSL